MKSICGKIQERLLSQGKTLSTAESCTSGRIAAELTKVPGASGYFQGGMVVYQDWLKIQFLDVSATDIEQHDVVSQPVVEQMVRGACRLLHTDYALASTGYAGEGNGRIPSGTIWIGWGSQDDVHSCMLTCQDDRESNTQTAVREVLLRFLSYLEER